MLCKVRKYELCDQKYANGCESCGRNLAQPDVKPPLCDVLAELSEYEFYDEKEGFSVSLDDIRKILSKYFA